MMVVTPAISNLIRENKTYRIDSSIQTGAKDGMFLMDDSLFRLWREGLCEKEEILLKSSKPGELAERVRAAEEGAIDDDDDEEEEEEEDEDEEEDERPRGKKPAARGRKDDDEDDE